MKFGKTKQVLGIDFGHSTIQVVVIDPSANHHSISQLFTFQTPADSVKDGVVIDVELLGTYLKQQLRENHIGISQAALSVGGGSVVVRTVKMPKMTEAALRKSIKLEASRYVPSSVEESYIDFEILENVDEHNMEVLIATAPRDVTDSRIEACRVAGLEVVSVEVGALANFRAVIECDPENDYSEKIVGIVDIGSHQTTISVINRGKFSMTRCIQSGGHLLTQQLMTHFNLAEVDAEAGKAQLSFLSISKDQKPVENPPLRVLQPVVDDLVRELRRSINYWQSQIAEGRSSKQLDLLILTGGGSKLQHIDDYISMKLSIPCKVWKIYNNPNFSASKVAETEHGADHILAIGLAVGANGKSPKVKSNTIAEEGTESLVKKGFRKKSKTSKGLDHENAPGLPDDLDLISQHIVPEGVEAPLVETITQTELAPPKKSSFSFFKRSKPTAPDEAPEGTSAPASSEDAA